MNNFYCNLVGASVKDIRGGVRKVVAAWLEHNGSRMAVKLLVVGPYNETFIQDLPDTGIELFDIPVNK
jgi:hypothetical protein